MAFPTTPTNGQTVVVNNITYQYSSATNSWARLVSTANVISANIITANTLNINTVISVTGNITTGSYFIGDGSKITNISPNAVSISNIVNGNTNITIGAAGSNANITVGGTSNVAVFATTGEYITGLLSASGNITGGNLLTSGAISATGTLSVTGATTLGTASTGNLSAGNVTTGGLASAAGNVTGGNILTAGLVSATGNITGGNLVTGGLISATGNINTVGALNINSTTGNYNVLNISGTALAPYGTPQTWKFFTNNIALGSSGSWILFPDSSQQTTAYPGTSTTLSLTGNITGGNLLTGGLLSATGNVSGNYILGNGALLTGVITSVSNINNGTSNVTVVSSGGNVSVGVGGTSNVAVFATTGEYVTGLISASGNITGGNILTGGLISATGTVTSAANITGGNLLTSGLASITGNVIAGNVNTSTIRPTSGALTIGTGTGNINLNPAGNIVLTGNTYINNLASPAQASDAATKEYVDNFATTGISYHQPVFVATTANLATTTGGTITYTQPNGAGNGIGAKLTTTGTFNLIDTGNVQSVGTRILVKDEGNAVFNGVYTWANATNIVRSTDADEYGSDSANALSVNDYFFTTNGNVNAGTAFIVSAPAGTITFGTSNITFSTFSSSQVYTANTSAGLSLTGTVFSAKVDNTTTAFDAGGNIIVKASATLTTPNIGAATGTSLSTTGNITGGNILTGGLISATGNLTVGNISTTIANVTTFNSAQGGNVTGTLVATSANAQFFNQTNGAGYVTIAGYLSGVGNITGGNLLTGGIVSATGSISSDANVIAGTSTKAAPALHYTNTANTQYGALLMQKAGVERWLIGSDNSTANGNVVIRYNATTNYVTVTEAGAVIMTGNATGGNLLTGGLVSATGNVTGGNLLTAGIVSASGNIIGGSDLYVGNGAAATAFTNPIAVFKDTALTYVQIAAVNSSGNGSSDFTAYANNGDDTQSWVDMGFTGNTFNDTNYTVTAPGDGYLFAQGNTATGGNLVLATGAIGNTKDIVFATGGFLTGNIKARLVNSTGAFSVTANVIGGNLTTGGQVTATANITGGNILTSGLVSATANITGGNILTGGLVSATANITGGNILTAGIASVTGTITTAGGTNGTGFAVGNGAVSNVGLGFFPTAGIRGDYAIRDYSTVFTNLYFDAGVGGTGGAAFQFRASNSYTQYANINSSGVISTRIVSSNDNMVINSTGSEGGQLVLAWANVNGLTSQANSTWNLDVDASNNLRAFYQNAAGASQVLIQVSPTSNIVTFPQSAGVSATGNISAPYFIGNGSQLTGIAGGGGSSITNGTSNVVVAASGNVTVGIAGVPTVATFTTSGLTANIVAATNNGNGTNFKVGDDVWIGDINIADTMSIRGQQSAVNGYIVFGNADGTQLGRAGSGPLTYGAAFSAVGNVSGGNLLTVGLISATSTITSAANITGGNLLTGGLISATSTITGSSLLGTVASLSGNVTGGNILTGGLISATGRIFAASGNAAAPGITFSADTGQDTGFYWISDGNIGVSTNATLRATFDNNGNVSATGNVIGANILTAGIMSSTGNAIHSNVIINGTAAAGSGVLIVSGNIQTSTSNATANIGNASNYFNRLFAQATTALYADLAEIYRADAQYPPGTVLVFGGNQEVTISTTSHDARIAGVVSTNPAHVMNSGLQSEFTVEVGLIGRVPCQVIGPISAGDRVVSSNRAGVAERLDMSKYQPGVIIGKAVESYSGAGVGTIEVVVGRL